VAGQLALTALPHPLQLTLNWQQQQGVLSVAMPDTPPLTGSPLAKVGSSRWPLRVIGSGKAA
jgi:hypothetical protein